MFSTLAAWTACNVALLDTPLNKDAEWRICDFEHQPFLDNPSSLFSGWPENIALNNLTTYKNCMTQISTDASMKTNHTIFGVTAVQSDKQIYPSGGNANNDLKRHPLLEATTDLVTYFGDSSSGDAGSSEGMNAFKAHFFKTDEGEEGSPSK